MSLNCLREWAPLTDLFNKLPTKEQSGLFWYDVKLTCVDVICEHLALGTNLGIAYLFNRQTKDLLKLTCEQNSKKLAPLSVIKIISSVDFMVACGGVDGAVNIFQVPKKHPDSLPVGLMQKGGKNTGKIERYTVSTSHHTRITSLEWSKNGMKLFSGDKNGVVVLTEIDFYMHICKSIEVLNETYEIVQLNYNQMRLLVSTIYRSILCVCDDGKWRINQVGRKDRKVLGKFGAIFYKNQENPPNIVDVYCARPGLRLWKADSGGNVINTLLFKDLLNCKDSIEVPIMNPISFHKKSMMTTSRNIQREPCFGTLFLLDEQFVVTHSNDVCYVLDVKKMAILYVMSQFRSIISLATNKDEIFILEEGRTLIRVATKPETVPEHPQQMTLSLCADADTNFYDDNDDSTASIMVMDAEEAQESPKKHTRNGVYDEKFSDEIVFKQHRGRRRGNKKFSSLTCLIDGRESEKNVFATNNYTKRIVGVLPDLRSPESIQNDIEQKERILADILDFGKLCKISAIEDEEKSEVKPNIALRHCNEEAITERKEIVIEKMSIPVCVNIPPQWKLNEIKLQSEVKTKESPDDSSSLSLDDWEFV